MYIAAAAIERYTRLYEKNKVDFTTISQWTMNTHDDIIAIAAEDAGGGVCNFVFSLW